MTHPKASFLDLACQVGDLRFRLIDLDARGEKEGHCDCRCACLSRSVIEPVPLNQIRCAKFTPPFGTLPVKRWAPRAHRIAKGNWIFRDVEDVTRAVYGELRLEDAQISCGD